MEEVTTKLKSGDEVIVSYKEMKVGKLVEFSSIDSLKTKADIANSKAWTADTPELVESWLAMSTKATKDAMESTAKFYDELVVDIKKDGQKYSPKPSEVVEIIRAVFGAEEEFEEDEEKK